MKFIRSMLIILLITIPAVPLTQEFHAGDNALGTLMYENFEKPAACKSCHTDIYQQWTQAMMSQAYIHLQAVCVSIDSKRVDSLT